MTVLLQEPGKIYTSDLLRVLKHLQTEGRLGEAPPTTNYIGPPSIQVLDEYGHHTKAKHDNPRNTRAPKDADEATEKERDIEPRTRGRGSVSVLPYKPTSDFDLSMSGIAFSEADDEYEPLPTPEPKPDSDTEPEDEAAAKEQPQEKEELPPLPPPKPPPTKAQTWLPHDRTTRSTLPKPCRISDAVDLYIDEVRFLPDCVDVCKVTGRLYNHSLEEDAPPPPPILAYPVLTASQKCPTFGYRAVINEDRGFLNPDLVVMLTVYGYQTSIRTVAPVGSCLVSLFDSQLADPLLRVGAYQFRIRNGRPAPEGGVSNLKMTDMDQKKPIPALTVLVRILPHSKDVVPMPPYEEGYYRGNNCEPTPTERDLIHHYRYHPEYETRTVQDRLKFMMQGEGLETTDRRAMEDYMKKKLAMKVARRNVLPPATDFTYFTDYYTAKGMKVDIQGAYHLPDYMEDYYILAFAEVMDGDTATAEREKDEVERNALIKEKKAKGLDYKFIIDQYPLDEQRMMTSRVDMKSSRQSPQWLDENVTLLHPIMGGQSVLLVRLFGLKLAYTQSKDGLKPGTVKVLDDGKLSYKTPLCWGVVQLFAKGTAMGGTHFVPLFEGGPSVMVVAMLRKDPPAKALDAALKKNLIKVLPGASLDVRLWDAKITDFIELPQSTHRHLPKAVNADEKIMKGREATFDKKYDEFILKGMEQVDRFDLHKVLIESEFFRQAANIKFGNELNAALKQAGKEPMPPLPVFAS